MRNPLNRRRLALARFGALSVAFVGGGMATVLVAAGPSSGPEDTEREWSTWLVQVQHVARQDIAGDDGKRIDEVKAASESAATAADRHRLRRELDQAKAAAEAGRGAIVYGWSMHADADGKPVSQSRTMTAFLLPSTADNRRALERVKPGDAIAVAREGSRDLFTFGGRRHVSAERAALPNRAALANLTGPSGKFIAPPDRPTSEADLRRVETALAFVRTESRDNGSTLLRYTLSIKCEPSSAAASTMHVWFHARVVTATGETIGPILEHIEVPRGRSGGFSMSRSFEFITRGGTQLDEKLTTAELIAVQWR